MKMRMLIWAVIPPLLLLQNCLKSQDQRVKIVIMRHAEKADKGENAVPYL
jgi:hypothetical protein